MLGGSTDAAAAAAAAAAFKGMWISPNHHLGSPPPMGGGRGRVSPNAGGQYPRRMTTTAGAGRYPPSFGGAGIGGGGTSGGGMGETEFHLDVERILMGLDRRTTIMVRNVPNKYSQQLLLNEINTAHKGKYDFFYLPIDFKNKCNVGYAFINFIDPKSIIPFFKEFNGQRWHNFNSEKVCAISYARIQGRQSMISRFSNSSLMEKDGEYRPLLFHSSGPDRGKPEPFPLSSKHYGRRSGSNTPTTPTSYVMGMAGLNLGGMGMM